MSATQSDDYLSRLTTHWRLVREAHEGPPDTRTAARQSLLLTYLGAVRRYLHGAVRDAEVAEELVQEFSLRFLRGDFRRACPERGRFRDYVRTTLFRLVAEYWRRRHKGPQSLTCDLAEPTLLLTPSAAAEKEFLKSWHNELMARAWVELARVQQETGRPYYLVLRFRAEHPDFSSADMAVHLATRVGKPLTAVAVRQVLHRAREKFGDLLLEQVARSLADPSPDTLEQELVDLNLLDYCRPSLERYRRGQEQG